MDGHKHLFQDHYQQRSPTYHRGHYYQTCLVILTIYYLTAQGKHGHIKSSMINWSPLVLSWTSVWSLILIMINTIADVFDLIECSCEFLNWLLVKPHSIFIHARPCKIQSDFKGFQNTVIWNYEKQFCVKRLLRNLFRGLTKPTQDKPTFG